MEIILVKIFQWRELMIQAYGLDPIQLMEMIFSAFVKMELKP